MEHGLEDERVGHAAAWENVPDRGKSQCKSGQLEMCLMYLRNSKEAFEAEEEVRRRVIRDEVGDVT